MQRVRFNQRNISVVESTSVAYRYVHRQNTELISKFISYLFSTISRNGSRSSGSVVIAKNGNVLLNNYSLIYRLTFLYTFETRKDSLLFFK